ncbi:MAG TPA: SPOR domain-containing protein [Allosphingosinicella sp.]|nr:SPOR domain-containing protein [Allosphingosinicella sp.]
MSRMALKIAVSPLVLGLALAGCSTSKEMKVAAFQPPFKQAAGELGAARHHALAQEALAKGNTAGAVGHAEKAVELAPRDAGYRMLLGDLYLKSGRFLSADMAFGDVLTLDPANVRAHFSLALAEIALGKRHSALSRLELLSQTQSPADLGLAYALAGDAARAIAMLEPAARAPGADGRVRQNLALAYAIAGDWQRARIVASQDLSPAELGPRLAEWAAFVQPASGREQVATLLGVTPSQDAGRPVRLALAPAPVYAAAEAAAPEPQKLPEPQAAEAPATRVAAYVPAAESMAEPYHVKVAPPLAKIAPQPPRKAEPVQRSSGRYVVQLASYSSPSDLMQVWSQLQKRYGLGGRSAVSATVELPGKGRFHRLSVSGFASQADADQACRSIKSKGGSCFVRAISGDAPVRLASR